MESYENDNKAKNLSIKVIGVGGGGGNAIRNMIREHVKGVDFIAINTDLQALKTIKGAECLEIGKRLRHGLGAGADPKKGMHAAEASSESIKSAISGANMLLITAGMGGGTGTGAAPVVAKIAKKLGILTVGIVTKPFTFEGIQRMKNARQGIANLKKYVDTLIVVKNNNLFKVVKKKTSLMGAFKIADDVLRKGIQGISGILTTPGYVNVDFADITAVMKNQHTGLMGIGVASGSSRIKEATNKAISSPLLEAPITNAKQVLLDIAGDPNLSLYEAQEASTMVQKATVNDVNVIFGTSIDKSLKGKVRVTVIATGIHTPKHMGKRIDTESNNNSEMKSTTSKHHTHKRMKADPRIHNEDAIPSNETRVQREHDNSNKDAKVENASKSATLNNKPSHMQSFDFSFSGNNSRHKTIAQRAKQVIKHLPDWSHF